MTARTKSVLILCATLITGVIIGTFGTSALQNRRAQQIRDTRERGGMARLIQDVIEFESEEQRQQIQAVIDKAEVRFLDAHVECREILAAHRDSLRTELTALLDPDQRQRLERWLRRDRHSFRSRSPGSKSRSRRHNSNQHR